MPIKKGVHVCHLVRVKVRSALFVFWRRNVVLTNVEAQKFGLMTVYVLENRLVKNYWNIFFALCWCFCTDKSVESISTPEAKVSLHPSPLHSQRVGWDKHTRTIAIEGRPSQKQTKTKRKREKRGSCSHLHANAYTHKKKNGRHFRLCQDELGSWEGRLHVLFLDYHQPKQKAVNNAEAQGRKQNERNWERPVGRVRSIVISKLTVFSAPAAWKYRKSYRVLRYKLDLPWSLR